MSDAVEIKTALRLFKRTCTIRTSCAVSRKRGNDFRSVGGALAAGFVQKFVELSPDDLAEAQADEFGEAAIGGTNFSVERSAIRISSNE